MKQFRFLDWRIYSEAQALFLEVLKITNKIPREYRFELGGQINRSSFSVILNIAEGSGKSSDRELGRYLDIALGSLYETRAGIDTLKSGNYCSGDDAENVAKKIKELAAQIGGLKRKLNTKENPVFAVSRKRSAVS